MLEGFLWERVERRLATILPLVLYRPEAVPEEAGALAAAVARTPPTRSTSPPRRDAMRWPVWIVVTTAGALATAQERWEVLAALWNTTTHDGRPLAALTLGDAEPLAAAAVRSRPNVAIASPLPWLWHLAYRATGSALIGDHYPELLSGPTDDPVGACLSRIGDVSWLVTALAGRAGIAVDQYWCEPQVHPTLPDAFTLGSSKVERAARILFQTNEWTVGADVREWVASARRSVSRA
jgi:hypothetical protein